METLPPYLIHQILKRSTFEDRLLTLQRVNTDWRRWTPLDDLKTLKISDFERMRANPSVWRRQTPSSAYFQSNQKWLEILLEDVIPRAGAGVKSIHFDSSWPRINDVPPLFCAPEGFKRWKLTKPLLALIEHHCGRKLKELSLTEENFVYTELDPEAYPLLTSGGFPKLRRLAIARVDAAFGPYLRQLSLTSLAISGQNAPLDTAEPEKLKALHLSHPFPEIYGNHASFYLSRHFPNLEKHSEQLLVEFDQLSDMAQRKRLADYRQLPNFKRFQIQLGPDNAVRTELQSISGYGLPKLRGSVNLRVRQVGDLAANVRFLGQLRHVRVEGLLGYNDAVALFTSLPDLEHLTLACHWLTDEQHEESLLAEESSEAKEESKQAPKVNLSKLRNFRLTIWEQAPKWLRSLLKDVFGAARSLRSFRLQDYSDDDKEADGASFLDDIGLTSVGGHLKQLNCRVGTVKTCKRHLASLLQNQWPKLTSFVWHASRLRIDEKLSSEIAVAFPSLKRFFLAPPSGPVRPLLPGADPDDGLCQFEGSALTQLIASSSQLQELRLFASSTVDKNLGRAISAHRHLKTVKLWDTLLSDIKSLDAFLTPLDSGNPDGDYRRVPLYIEVFTLRSADKCSVSQRALELHDGNVFFLANGRSNAIDEQIFYFP